ncbi:MAG: WYL domain-containing protein [Lachnospira sp.]|nr:WYL domain-containing protein [Lachnospira sp.]
MPKKENQKLKLLYLAKIFKEKTDEEHGITLQEISEELARYEISATRKTLYSDIELLRDFGMDIGGEQRNNNYYYNLLSSEFELAELKLLVDAVQSSKFITLKKSNELIKKLEGLVSIYQGRQMQRQVVVSDRIKAMNESIYYNVDKLHEAINNNSSVDFVYSEWNLKKELVPRSNGTKKNISPWALLWDDENYYLVAYDDEAKGIRHYRVDKMSKIIITGKVRLGEEHFSRTNTAQYAKRVFGMFNGTVENVTIELENRLVGVILDRFGKDVMIIPQGKEHFRVHIDVVVSNMFLSWIIGLGSGVKIVGPEHVVDRMKDEIKRLQEQYGG